MLTLNDVSPISSRSEVKAKIASDRPTQFRHLNTGRFDLHQTIAALRYPVLEGSARYRSLVPACRSASLHEPINHVGQGGCALVELRPNLIRRSRT